MMKVLVDGVFFQLAQSGISRIWETVLPRLADSFDIVLLDRGRAPELPGIERIPFCSHASKFNADESALLERVCRHYAADLFLSTYYTTPLGTPSVLLVYDMIPERLGFELEERDWREKELAIAHARRHVCISQQTRRDLLEFYPELNEDEVEVGYCGLDPEIFKPATASAGREFCARIGLEHPYFMFVGSRTQHKAYKNTRLFFEALSTCERVDFDVLCVGGERDLQPWVEELTPAGCQVLRVDLPDRDLALAYSSAAALVYPSLYEGFGMPVIEAMACGCPVIATGHGGLEEVAGSAAYKIGGHSVLEMAEALRQVRVPEVRERLRAAGERQARKFRWQHLTDALARNLRKTGEAAAAHSYAEFYRQWTELRMFQSEVDILL